MTHDNLDSNLGNFSFKVMKAKIDISNNLSRKNENTDGNILSRNKQLNEQIIKIAKVMIAYIQNTKSYILRHIQFKFLEEFQTGIVFYMGVEGIWYYQELETVRPQKE